MNPAAQKATVTAWLFILIRLIERRRNALRISQRKSTRASIQNLSRHYLCKNLHSRMRYRRITPASWSDLQFSDSMINEARILIVNKRRFWCVRRRLESVQRAIHRRITPQAFMAAIGMKISTFRDRNNQWRKKSYLKAMSDPERRREISINSNRYLHARNAEMPPREYAQLILRLKANPTPLIIAALIEWTRWVLHKREMQNKRDRKARRLITDAVARRLIRKGTSLSPSDVPQAVIQLKRDHLRLKREIKSQSIQ